MMWYNGLSQINRDLLYFTFIPVHCSVQMWFKKPWSVMLVNPLFMLIPYFHFYACVLIYVGRWPFQWIILWSRLVWYNVVEVCSTLSKIDRASSISYGCRSYTKVAIYFKVKQTEFPMWFHVVSFLVFLFLGRWFWLILQDLLDFCLRRILVSRPDKDFSRSLNRGVLL